MTTQDINDFKTESSTEAPDRILPQKMGAALWRPMFVMSLMAFAIGFILSLVRANMISTGDDPLQIAAFGQYIPAAMFFGFATVFAAISFAIAKILGEFRVGGGSVQEAAGGGIETLKVPGTVKAFIVLMAMGMMILLVAVVLHVIAGVSIAAGDWSAVKIEQWTIWLEAARRFGVVLYLFAITLGLVAIATVIRFQTFRIRQVAGTQ
ncbi:MAG: hypothetical protein BMS9Abin12_1396 [Acidimicrobiia bacterium]|nr:MAG: hypothetical protein BMS9Abin12_1396 [Acidimicrobiia bacterium]